MGRKPVGVEVDDEGGDVEECEKGRHKLQVLTFLPFDEVKDARIRISGTQNRLHLQPFLKPVRISILEIVHQAHCA